MASFWDNFFWDPKCPNITLSIRKLIFSCNIIAQGLKLSQKTAFFYSLGFFWHIKAFYIKFGPFLYNFWGQLGTFKHQLFDFHDKSCLALQIGWKNGPNLLSRPINAILAFLGQFGVNFGPICTKNVQIYPLYKKLNIFM